MVGLGHVALIDAPAFEQAAGIGPAIASFPAQNLLCRIAGGPPYQVYTLPLGLGPKVFTGTSVIFFAVTNAVKLIPYFALGQFDMANLTTSAVLMPLAPLSTIAGAFVVKRMPPEVFYPFTYATIAAVAVMLVYEGVADLVAT